MSIARWWIVFVAVVGLSIGYAVPVSHAAPVAHKVAVSQPADGTTAAIRAHPGSVPSTLVPIAGKPGKFMIAGCPSAVLKNPRTASDAVLNEYGLPLPEWYQGGRTNSHWMAMTAHPLVRDCEVGSTNFHEGAAANTPAPAKPDYPTDDGYKYSNFFGGYMDWYPALGTFPLEEGDFAVPLILTDDPYDLYGDAMWSGLGGYSNCLLTQSGIIGESIYGTITDYMWVENLGNIPSCNSTYYNSSYDNYAYVDSTWNPRAHDKMYSTVDANSMYIEDTTLYDGLAHSYSLAFGPSGWQEQYTCMLERLAGNNYYLPDNDDSVFNYCEGWDAYYNDDQGGWFYIGGADTPDTFHQYDFMMTTDGTVNGFNCIDLGDINSTGGFDITTGSDCTNDWFIPAPSSGQEEGILLP